MSTPRQVLITDAIDPTCEALLREAGLEPLIRTGCSREELIRACAPAEGWIIRSGTTIDPELMEAAPKLRAIGRAGVGVDNVDLEAATRRGIIVLNAPEGNTVSTAEHTVAMLLALARRIAPANATLREGKWERKAFVGAELYGKTVGVVGVGKIGRAVIERLCGFGVTLIGYDPILSTEAAERLGVQLMELDDLVASCDFLTVHTPLTESTRGMIGEQAFSRCKSSLAVVNCARGGIVDETALLWALDDGRVAAAALDVYTKEPPGDDAVIRALVAHPRVLATPHIAASTGEAQEKVARQVTEQLIRALRDEPVTTAVNAAALRVASRPEVRPWMDLAMRLGSAAAQLLAHRDSATHLDRLLLRCHGELPRRHADVLKVAILQGFLGELRSGPVNLVSAPILAEESGLTVDFETVGGASRYTSLLEVVGSGPSHAASVGGTLFGSDEPRITDVDGFAMEIVPRGRILFYHNVDRPGMLAAVGSILSEARVNIASMALGRTGQGEQALTAMSIDGGIDESVLSRIRSLDGIHDVRIVDLG